MTSLPIWDSGRSARPELRRRLHLPRFVRQTYFEQRPRAPGRHPPSRIGSGPALVGEVVKQALANRGGFRSQRGEAVCWSLMDDAVALILSKEDDLGLALASGIIGEMSFEVREPSIQYRLRRRTQNDRGRKMPIMLVRSTALFAVIAELHGDARVPVCSDQFFGCFRSHCVSSEMGRCGRPFRGRTGG
jgi:hypothetical protein